MLLAQGAETTTRRDSVCGSATHRRQSTGIGTGHSVSHDPARARSCARKYRLDQRHASACATRFARKGFRST